MTPNGLIDTYEDETECNRRLATVQLQAVEEYRARAECSMRAQEANSNNFGLIHGFFAGLGTGSACIEYYQKLGVIR